MTRTVVRQFTVGAAAFAVAASALVAASPAAAANGTISGTVISDSSSIPIQNIVVAVYTSAGVYVSEANTSSSGDYSISVAPGDYTLRFGTQVQPNYVGEWYGDSLFESGATTITVGDGATVDADASLETSKTIAGTITSAAGPFGFSSNQVSAYAWDAGAQTWVLMGGAVATPTTATEPYLATGLSSKVTYRLRFSFYCSEASCPILAPEWYNDESNPDDASEVAVGATGIDATLSPVPTVRIAGADRFETSALISEEYDSAQVDTVYLSNGLNFPDALGAAPAAVVNGAPLLLTAPQFLPDSVADALEDLNPSRVVITGSEASVSAAVEDAVADLLPSADIDRLGGADRFETSRLIIEDAFPTGATEAWVATGFIFADALAAAPVAGKDGAPVILVNGTSGTLDAATIQLIEDLGVTQINIAGGTPSVSAGIAAALEDVDGVMSVTRYAGADRYDTSRAINAIDPTYDGNIFLATGVNFADALAGAALAGLQGNPLYLSPGTCVTPGVRAGIQSQSPTQITVLGGPTTITPAAANLISC